MDLPPVQSSKSLTVFSYCSGFGACALAWLETYVAAINSIVMIGGLVLAAGTFVVNWYYQAKRSRK